MRLRCLRDERQITVSEKNTLGKGGEAQVYAVDGDLAHAAKVYEASKEREERALKLLVMRDHPPTLPNGPDGHTPIAWPIDLLCDNAGSVVGFLMPRVHNASQIIDFYNPKTRLENCPLFDYRYLLRTARNLAAAVRVLHARGYIIGDLKHSNVLVTNTALVTLVDTDSFQVTDPQTGHVYGCPVRTPDFTPPELQGQKQEGQPLSVSHDLFALGVLIFHLLMEGTHPFAGVYEGEGDPPAFEERIAAGHFPYGCRPGPYHPSSRHAPAFGMLPPGIQRLMLQCFEQGHSHPDLRPDARSWQQALDEAMQSLRRCGVNAQHFYSNHLSACPWCERKSKQLRGIDPFPSENAVLNRMPVTPVRPIAPARPVLTSHAVPNPSPRYAPPPVASYASRPKSFVPARLGIAVGIFALISCLPRLSVQTNISRPDMRVNNEQYMNPPTVNPPTSEDTTATRSSEASTAPTTPTATPEADTGQMSSALKAVSAKGNYLAVTSPSDNQESIYIWNRATGKWLPTITASSNVSALDFSKDGSLLAVGGRNGIDIFRVATCERLTTLPTSAPLTAMSLSPDGAKIACVLSDTSGNAFSGYSNAELIQIYQIDLTANRFTLQSSLNADANGTILSLHYSPDGRWLAVHSMPRPVASSSSANAVSPQLQETTTLWEVDTDKRGVQITSKPYSTLAFSPDGTKLALGGTNVEVFRIDSGGRIGTFEQAGALSGMSFSSDGTSLTVLEYMDKLPYIQDYHISTPQGSDSSTAAPIHNNEVWPSSALLVDNNTIIGFNFDLTTVQVFKRTHDGNAFSVSTE